jgi:ribosomal protein L37AE/L43A
MSLPESIYLKKIPWWKFWIRRKPARIPFIKELKKEAIFTYRICNARGMEIVQRRPSDPIYCSVCNREFKPTKEKEETHYNRFVAEIWACQGCLGRISVMLYEPFGTSLPDNVIFFETNYKKGA